MFHRDELDRLQREFRTLPGCSVIIYDQTCATEKRRRRKRGTLATLDKTVVINELVCEGCGDCSTASNCLSVEPLETEFGRKRRINQNSCNKDFSCVNGFCPSFVTVQGQLKKPAPQQRAAPALLQNIPHPTLPNAEQAWGIVVAGVGGTGVITIGSLLGMAAHLEGKGVITQDAAGLAQKGGATWSHIQIANHPDAIYTTKVDTAKADLVIGCDAIVAANKTTLAAMQAGRSFVVLNTHGTPTAAFVHDAQWQFPGANCQAAIAAAVGASALASFDAEQVAVQLLGDSIYTNPLLLGYAWQQGRVPLSEAAILRAMELNGVQVEKNQTAFAWGRACAHDLPAVQALFTSQQVIQWVKQLGLDEVVQRRVVFLTDYQNATYAQQYQDFVQRVQQAEAALEPQASKGASQRLSLAVARNLFKLMAYKDEYEVARLHTDPSFIAKLDAMFEDGYQLTHHLAPPLTAKKNDKGELIKQAYGPWMRQAFVALAKLKGLRAGLLDVFGKTAERRGERALIAQYRQCIEELLAGLQTDKLPLALQIANIPEDIRGFGHVKERHLHAAQARWSSLMQQWRQS